MEEKNKENEQTPTDDLTKQKAFENRYLDPKSHNAWVLALARKADIDGYWGFRVVMG